MTLLASRDVLLRRRRSHLETTRGPAAGQLDHVLEALQAPEFARHLNTDGLPIGAVASDIACHAGLTLEPDTDGLARRRVRRIGVQLRHISMGICAVKPAHGDSRLLESRHHRHGSRLESLIYDPLNLSGFVVLLRLTFLLYLRHELRTLFECRYRIWVVGKLIWFVSWLRWA